MEGIGMDMAAEVATAPTAAVLRFSSWVPSFLMRRTCFGAGVGVTLLLPLLLLLVLLLRLSVFSLSAEQKTARSPIRKITLYRNNVCMRVVRTATNELSVKVEASPPRFEKQMLDLFREGHTHTVCAACWLQFLDVVHVQTHLRSGCFHHKLKHWTNQSMEHRQQDRPEALTPPGDDP